MKFRVMNLLNKNLYLIVIAFLSAISFTINAQDANKTPDWLLLNPDVQLEANDAINNLYNFKFEKADSAFKVIKNQYPKHPLAYFLLGLSQYWRMVPDDNNRSFDNLFFQYMDSSITFSEKLKEKEDENEEANFFLAAAYGFKGRIYEKRNEYPKATFAAAKAYHFLNLDVKNTELSPEFLFGVALYNYFREWIPEAKPFMKTVMWAFSHGDEKLALKQLNTVALNAFYTRTEAQYYLYEIYSKYAPDHAPSDSARRANKVLALKTIKYLHETYPDNAYFHRMYAKSLYELNDNNKYGTLLEKVSKEIIAKYNNKMFGYNDYAIRYSSWYLGNYYESHFADFENSAKFYKLHIETCEKLNETYGYYIYALDRLATLESIKNDYDKAIECCEKIKKYANKKNKDELECLNKAKQNIILYKKKKAELKK